ncbi:molybdenum ABC transporter molybdate-binding protein [Pullulanibacillus pueri]|uniref:ABC transporter domain-containing protein n=1 Tax=Pullulanibacillus pueri TaxID=1437324 RepID=A0A8J3EMP5_9BACL|nr:molybdate ABC transporter substrate-binding protein [Pullulanibacillus pueri]MBM7680951.1 molybdenum ABC transporter molybdate-binding protein [Pullulanibacillus pueri]GGH81462.1 hypothetical protein GCM10007096_19400 [Pullulanibacillus pueri]
MLSFHFKKKLRDFELNIEIEVGNKTLALIGHSGCGKTTTLQLLAGLQTPDEGFVEINGTKLTATKENLFIPTEDRQIGFVFQDYALFPHLSVRENILYGIRHLERPEKKKRLEEVLSLLQLEALEDVFPTQLSGGQQQRVALARALVTRPSLLLLDEPLSALDISTRSHVRTELKGLLDSLSIPCVVVTHDYEDARVLGDEIAVIDQGSMIQKGTPEEIIKQPASPFVAEFVGTNLVVQQAEDSSHCKQSLMIAFHPWEAEVSQFPLGKNYHWEGDIVDISTLGAFDRLHIKGNQSFLIDVPTEASTFKRGDHVYIGVSEDKARVYASHTLYDSQTSTLSKERQHQLQKKSMVLRRRKNRWKISVTITSMVAVIIFLILFSGIKGFAGTSHTGKVVTMEALIAANATDPMNTIIKNYERANPAIAIKASYAGTQIIQTQLEQGAPADIFLSANLSHIQTLQKEGYVKDFYKVSKNHEVIIVPKNNPAQIHNLQDLGKKQAKLIIGVDTVPIGQYTRQIINKASRDYGPNFKKDVMGRVASTETNVKQILEKISMGNGDAGVVYLTDVTAQYKSKVKIIEIPEKYNVESINYIAVTTKGPHPKRAKAFLDYILSAKGQGVFADYHYDPTN